MTENQAKTKWCPFARVMTQFPDRSMVPVSGNRLTDEDGPGGIRGSNCLASACMAWRDTGEISDDKARADREYRELGRRLDVARHGYCGLAGRPE